MDLVIRVKDLYNLSLKYRWLNLGALFCVVQASGIRVSGSGWGLDPSWVWLTSQASREMLFQSKNFIWTYGPLGFLDFIPNDWRVGFVLSTLFAVLSTLFLFYTTYFLWLTKTKDSTKALVSTILLTTFVDVLTPPSVGLVFGMTSLLLLNYLKGTHFRNNLMLQFMAITTAMLFYLKIFPFTVFIIIVTGLILRPDNSRKFRDYVVFVSSLVAYILGLAILLKFPISSFIFWFSGYLEMLRGFRAMSSEESGRKWEYLFVFILIVYTLLAAWRFSRSRFLLITFIFSTLLFFSYGFIRHDGHSQTTFVWLTYLIFVLTHFQRLRINIFIALVLLLTGSIQILQIRDHFLAIQTGLVEVIRSIDPKYGGIISSDRSKLVNTANLSPQFLGLIKERTISILPYDQLIAKGYGFNFVTFPIPQPYSAYTPKLDAINARFVHSDASPKFILMNGPMAIDGRNPIWEAPLTNIAILCNYETVLSDAQYLLLERRLSSACDYTDLIEDQGGVDNSDGYIETIEVLSPDDIISKLNKLLPKQLKPEIMQVNGKDWNLVSANRKFLILNVPPSLDYPGKWKIGNSNKITKTQTGIRKQFVKVNIQD